jgi:CHAT domain-containing protein
MMTLWPVSDSLTVAVMKDFYTKSMAKDGDAPVALAEVQRDYLVAIRKMSQFRKKKIGVKKAVDLAGPFILSFQKEATGEEATDPAKN